MSACSHPGGHFHAATGTGHVRTLGQYHGQRLYVRKGIKSIKEVKRIAISRFGSNADFAARYLLQREGLKPDIDVALLQVGNQSNRIAAVETTMPMRPCLTPPMTLQARKARHDLTARRVEVKHPYSSLMFVSRRPYFDQDTRRLVNFTKAMIEGVALYKSNKEFSLKVLSKYMKVQDREVLEENFKEYDFPLKPYPRANTSNYRSKKSAKRIPKY
jgi:ABC-type nitrate/sulfonate/bicarbonate transport system substrate-binding protein